MTRPTLDVLAHELRSPVAALAAIAAAYGGADEPTRVRLRELAAAAGAGIERLLADPALTSYGFERLDVAALVEASVQTWELEGASIATAVEESLIVSGDPARLRQALDNLIANAIGHSRDRAPVTVTARRRESTIAVEVSDEGDGIEAADLERVFEPGVRRTSTRPGAGLGLAIVRAIAQAHAGEVSVESSPGKGSTFRLVLPGAFDEG